MNDMIDTPNSRQPSTQRHSADDSTSSFERSFQNLRRVNEVVESVVRDIMNDLDRAEIEDGLEGGFLRCSHTTEFGGRIEINAISMDNLASPNLPDTQTRERIEEKMCYLADTSIASLGSDTVESLFGSADSAAQDEDEFLAVHQVEDISFFTVLSSGKSLD